MRSGLTNLARDLRRHDTAAEHALWMKLRNRQTHSEQSEIARDMERTAFLETNGVRTVRFTNADVIGNIDGVLEMIYLQLGQQPAPSPGARKIGAGAPGRRPLPKGRGEDGAHRT